MHEQRFTLIDRAYSAWHRRFSIARFVGIEKAQLLSMIDLDAALYVEYDDRTREPLALIETARDTGRGWKSSTITARLARRAGLPCYCVLYTCANDPNPADPRYFDVIRLRVLRRWPRPETKWRTLTPHAWAHALLQIRAWSARRLDVEAANDDLYGQRAP